MAVVVDATVGGANANSLLTRPDADAILAETLDADDWFAENEGRRDRALIQATRDLDVLAWKGVRATSEQALALPRKYMEDPDLPASAASAYLPEDEIPERALRATALMALEVLRASGSSLSERDTARVVRRRKVDVIETEYFEPPERAQGLARYPRIVRLLEPLLEGANVVTRT